MKTIKFSKHYSKLNDDKFTTIRTSKKNNILNQDIGILIHVKGPRGKCAEIRDTKYSIKQCDFVVKCVKIEKTKLGLIDRELLKKDTDTTSGIGAWEELRKYYTDLELNDIVYVYYFEKQGLKA